MAYLQSATPSAYAGLPCQRQPQRLIAEALGLPFDAAGKLRIQRPVVLHDAPVRRDTGVPFARVFLRGLGGDADEDAGDEWAGGSGGVPRGEVGADLRNGPDGSLRDVANGGVDVAGAWDQERAAAQALLHLRWDFNHLGQVRIFHLLPPALARAHGLFIAQNADGVI